MRCTEDAAGTDRRSPATASGDATVREQTENAAVVRALATAVLLPDKAAEGLQPSLVDRLSDVLTGSGGNTRLPMTCCGST